MFFLLPISYIVWPSWKNPGKHSRCFQTLAWYYGTQNLLAFSIFRQEAGRKSHIHHRCLCQHVIPHQCCITKFWCSHLLGNLFSLHAHSCAKSIHALQGPFSWCLGCHSLSIPLTLRPWQLLDFKQQLICQSPPARHLLMLPISISC